LGQFAAMIDPMSGQRRDVKREPALNIPLIVLALGLVLVALHVGRQWLGNSADWQFIARWAFVPARLSLWLGYADLGEVLAASFGPAASTMRAADLPGALRLLVTDGANAMLTLATYGLLHGSWGHLVSNTLWLVVFGSPVARRLGDMRFLVLMLVTSAAGALAHWLTDPLELSPLIGASAAVSGATAAAARFVFQPGIRFGDLGRDQAVRAIPAANLRQLFGNPRALAFIGIWFAANLVFGTGVVPLAGEDASIAWQAHIGGFVAGLALFPLFDRGRGPRRMAVG
jgi:membrane associated rhomboid family serine protease